VLGLRFSVLVFDNEVFQARRCADASRALAKDGRASWRSSTSGHCLRRGRPYWIQLQLTTVTTRVFISRPQRTPNLTAMWLQATIALLPWFCGLKGRVPLVVCR